MPLLHGFGLFAGAGGGGGAIPRGFTMMGNNSGTAIRRLDMSTDVWSTLAAAAPYSAREGAGFCSATAGYQAGGRLGPNNTGRNTVAKLDYATETAATLAPTMSDQRVYNAAFDSSTAGYAMAGNTVSNSGFPVTSVEKMPFSTETMGSIAATIAFAVAHSGGFSSSTAGYQFGGVTEPGTTFRDTVNKITFSTDTRTTTTTLVNQLRDIRGMDSLTAGYAMGGYTGSANITTVQKFAFSDDSRTSLASGLSSARNVVAGFSSSTAGYAAGGYLSPGGDTTTVDKWEFSDDSRTTLGTGLPAIDRAASGLDNTRYQS